MTDHVNTNSLLGHLIGLVSPTAVQRLLGCSARIARDLQIESARLRPFQVISKAVGEHRDRTKFEARALLLLTGDSRVHEQCGVLSWH